MIFRFDLLEGGELPKKVRFWNPMRGIVSFEFLAVNIRVHNLNGNVCYTILRMAEVIRVRLCLTKHQRYRVAHELIAGPGY